MCELREIYPGSGEYHHLHRVVEAYVEIASKPGTYVYVVDRNTYWEQDKKKVDQMMEKLPHIEFDRAVTMILKSMWLHKFEKNYIPSNNIMQPLVYDHVDDLKEGIPVNYLLQPEYEY
jgi:hypothetical protein